MLKAEMTTMDGIRKEKMKKLKYICSCTVQFCTHLCTLLVPIAVHVVLPL